MKWFKKREPIASRLTTEAWRWLNQQSGLRFTLLPQLSPRPPISDSELLCAIEDAARRKPAKVLTLPQLSDRWGIDSVAELREIIRSLRVDYFLCREPVPAYSLYVEDVERFEARLEAPARKAALAKSIRAYMKEAAK